MLRYQRFIRTCTLTLATVAGLSASANAQLFNIDFDDPTNPMPTVATHAAAGTAGVWNSINSGQGPTVFNLVDKAGAATGVTMTLSVDFVNYMFLNPVYGPGDDTLMQDITYGVIAGQAETIDFAGLANGTYDIYTYAQAPDSKTGFITGVDCTESLDGLQAVGGANWAGNHVLGQTYAKHKAVVTAGTLHLDITDINTYMSINGIQIELADSQSGTPYCFGDGTGATCPCTATSAPGYGCINTSGAGAIMYGTGNALFSSDTFQLQIDGAPGNKPGLVLRGVNAIAVPAGDGILCTAGMSMRSHVQVTAAGSTTYTDFNGAPFGSIAVTGGVPTYFQFWYRDPQNPCTGAGFNFTNGVAVIYLP